MSAMPPSTPAAIEAWEVLDLLTALVQKSLVVYEEDEQGQGRYHLLEPMRQYARDRLREGGEGEAVRERHGQCFLQLAEAARAAAGEGKGDEAFERLEREHDNLRAALEWSDGREAEMALRLAGALGEFWFERGYWNEGRQWLERALGGASGAEPTAERARALAAAGRLATSRRGESAARNWLEESIALYRVLGDTRSLVEALTYLAELLRLMGNRAVARAVQEEGVALARTVGDPRLLAMALSVLGLVIREIGEAQAARVVLEESLALARQVGDRGLMSQALQRLADVFSQQGEGPKARELLEESVELARAAKNKSFLFWALYSLAEALTQQGDPERAKPLREECLLLARELRTPRHVGWAMRGLVAHGLSYEEALQMVEQATAEYGPEVVRYVLWALVVRAPSYEEALQWIDQAAREHGPEVAIHSLGALGHRAREQSDYQGAATCYRRSLVLRREVEDRFAIAQSLEDFAVLAARQQQWERASILLGAAEGVCAAAGRTLPVAAADEYERAVHGAREALGEAAFAAAWAAGRAMTLDQAITSALEGETLPGG